MKMIRTPSAFAIAAAVTLVLAGCSKSQKLPKSVQVSGMSVDMPKLQESFNTATNAELQKVLFDMDQGFRYRDYVRCLMALDELSNRQDVAQEQKKLIADVIDQVKKIASSAPAPAK